MRFLRMTLFAAGVLAFTGATMVGCSKQSPKVEAPAKAGDDACAAGPNVGDPCAAEPAAADPCADATEPAAGGDGGNPCGGW